MRYQGLLLSAVLLAGAALSGCGELVPPRLARVGKPAGSGPPPHAPAHGYRHKHASGVDLRFDSDLALYVVVGELDHYFHKNEFYRLYESVWEVAAALEGPWSSVSAGHLPPGLGKKHPGKAKGHGKGKGKKH